MPKKLIDLDLLKDFRQKYDTRLKNGTLVPAKAQIAEQIANVSEDVGSTQEEPFIFQATATDNGLDSVETAPIAKHLEKQGNSVVVNQLAKALNSTNWNASNSTVTFSSGVATFTASAQSGGINSQVNVIQGHTYLICAEIKSNSATNIQLSIAGGILISGQNISTKQFIGRVGTWNYASGSWTLKIEDTRTGSWDAVEVSDVYLVDLTQWGFTADEITDLTAHPEHFFNYYNGSLAYNTGTLTNSNGRYLKCIGRNQWDEEYRLGHYDLSSGAYVSESARLCSKNPIKVIPNTTYYFKGNFGYGICFYDKDMNYLGYIQKNNATATTPSNCLYIQFTLSSDYGTTYNHDITISIYYADGTDYDQNFPYEENTYDTGTEVLRSAGSIRDIKLPDGSIVRNVGVVDLSTLSWTNYATNKFSATLTGGKPQSDGDVPFNAICSKLIAVGANTTLDVSKKQMSLGSNNTIYVANSDWNSSSDINGILYFELATPTTEQGTSFAENVIVDNYGSMGWLDTDSNFVSVPQGSEFFYPADYVEFLDSLYTRSKDGGTSADVSNIVVASELTSEETARTSQDTILQNAIGGTLRQLLASSQSIDFLNTAFKDLGDCDWTASSTTLFHTSSLNGQIKAQTGAKIVCTIYKMVSDTSSLGTGPTIVVAQSFSQTGVTSVVVKSAIAYDNATAFKAAMKGVLLAYEKA